MCMIQKDKLLQYSLRYYFLGVSRFSAFLDLQGAPPLESSVGLGTPRYLTRDTFNRPYGNPNRRAMGITAHSYHIIAGSMHIRMELTLVLVSGVEADTPKKQ